MTPEKPPTDRDLLVSLLDSDNSAVAQGVAYVLRQNEALADDVNALKNRVTELEKSESPAANVDALRVMESRTERILSMLSGNETRLLRMEKTTSRIHLVYQAIGAGIVALAIELFRLWGHP